jgi:hypothetical protein
MDAGDSQYDKSPVLSVPLDIGPNLIKHSLLGIIFFRILRNIPKSQAQQGYGHHKVS